MNSIVIVTKKTQASQKLVSILKDKIDFVEINDNDKLEKTLSKTKPEWVFFTHWSEIVKAEIFEKYKCVVMHTGNLPEDRGGSPIQNQILKGVNFTKVSAIQMQNPLDSGAIYCSKKVSLQGSLNDIMMMLTKACVDLIIKCVTKNPTAVNQKGVPTYNKRKYDNSIKFNCSIEEIYDQIRMLDGDDYPKTHIDFEGFRFEFTRASLSGESILSDVKIFKHQK